MIYFLDTHTWIWWNMNPQKLSQRVKEIIGDINVYKEILLSAISPWEFSKLLEKEELEYDEIEKIYQDYISNKKSSSAGQS